MQNLLPQTPATLLPAQTDADEALAAAIASDVDTSEPMPEQVADPTIGHSVEAVGEVDALRTVAARFPAYSGGWARLAERALESGDAVTAYAYARTGYHRGLDLLRRNGWRGHGPVPWSHEPNRGFLRSLNALAQAAAAIGEADEAARCADFLRDCDPMASDALAG
jgi:hypothetical protein